jgi:hypothetical protein
MFNLFKKKRNLDCFIKSADYNFDTDVNVLVDVQEIETIANWAEKQSYAVSMMHSLRNTINNDVANNADDFVVYAVLHCIVNNKQITLYKQQ